MKNKIFSGILLAIFFYPFVGVFFAFGNVHIVREDIRLLEIRIDEVASKREHYRNSIREIEDFASIAEKWFSRLHTTNTQIRDLESQIEKEPSFFLKEQLKDLKWQKRQIESLNGGNSVGDVFLSSMQDLKKEMSLWAGDIERLKEEEVQLTQTMDALFEKRGELIPKAELGVGEQVKKYEEQLEDLINANNILIKAASDKSMWFLRFQIEGMPVKYVRGNLFKTQFVEEFLEDVLDGRRKAYDRDELKAALTKVRRESEQLRKKIVQQVIPDANRDINQLRRLINELKKLPPSIEGSWVMYVGNSPYPEIDVRVRNEAYHGIIVKSGDMRFLNPNQEFFVVKSLNKTTYGGRVVSHDKEGRESQISLKLIVDDSGKTMTYSADEYFQLQRID